MKELWVELGPQRYPIRVERGLLHHVGEWLLKDERIKGKKAFLLSEIRVAEHYLEPVRSSLERAGFEVYTKVVSAGEASKSLTQVEEIVGAMLTAGIDRSSLLLALGGGVIGDLGGFIASVYMRGIPFIGLPTTILAHDSSIGGKVAVNHPLAKNSIGSFYHPLAVYYDPGTFATLPMREVKSGLAEVVKHALLAGKEFFYWLRAHSDALLSLDGEEMGEALIRGMRVKVRIVEADERETAGVRELLNLGHTIGHAVEAAAGYGEVLHGEAVAIGLVQEGRIARGRGLLSEEELNEIKDLLLSFGLPTELPSEMRMEELLPYMYRDKKNRDGKIRMALLQGIGTAKGMEVTEEEILALDQTK
ncbi:3-dehydroquinate synthase [[Clostridium] ultunense Esp]|nr:3-dehydroquinate synthase [[Clostridium] ultunense Esp]